MQLTYTEVEIEALVRADAEKITPGMTVTQMVTEERECAVTCVVTLEPK